MIQGKPAWRSQFIIAMIQTRFDDFDYEMSGKGDSLSCRCSAVRRKDGKKIYGSPVSLEMAKAEGWTKNSKWRTMPQLMLNYRAASFFGRQHVADLLLGVQTEEEVVDIQPVNVTVPNTPHEAAIAQPKEIKEDPVFEEEKPVKQEEPDDFGF